MIECIPFVGCIEIEDDTPAEPCKVYSFYPQGKEIVAPDDIWQCNCGCHLFYINPEGWTCSNCGTYQIFKE